MSDVVIQIDQVAKQYRLGTVGSGTLAGDLHRWWHLLRGREDPILKVGEVNERSRRGQSEYVWALRDVGVEIRRGDVVGFVGRNGAGKSTLLKILSRVTTPTRGCVRMKGTVASLLEVGTGFHPELTGRENIFLNGAILGMTKRKIRAQLDEIIDFSGCERYIDTPVKRYSSGMYVRLAFGVAAHLDPDIMIVDEVLAVGDAEFQKKCLGKMKDVAHEGRTVLFVSHNLPAVRSLCSRCVLLQNGTVLVDSTPAEAIDVYLAQTGGHREFRRPPKPDGSPTLVFGRFCPDPIFPENSLLELEIESRQTVEAAVEVRVYDHVGTPVAFGAAGEFNPHETTLVTPGRMSRTFRLDTSRLAIGTYRCDVALRVPWKEFLDRVDESILFDHVRPLDRPGQDRALLQTWGVGCYEIPFHPVVSEPSNVP